MAETLIVEAEISELSRASEWAAAFGQRHALPQSTLFAIQLCIEEALSNIVQYGFADCHDVDPRNKGIHLSLKRQDNAITATIEDRGVAFDPLGVSAPAQPTAIGDVPLGGRGIHLIREFAQKLEYERLNGVNRLMLSFACPNQADTPRSQDIPI